MLAKIKSYSGQEKDVASTLFAILEQIGSSVKSKSTEESSFSLSIEQFGKRFFSLKVIIYYMKTSLSNKT
mgnify:FL=1